MSKPLKKNHIFWGMNIHKSQHISAYFGSTEGYQGFDSYTNIKKKLWFRNSRPMVDVTYLIIYLNLLEGRLFGLRNTCPFPKKLLRGMYAAIISRDTISRETAVLSLKHPKHHFICANTHCQLAQLWWPRPNFIVPLPIKKMVIVHSHVKCQRVSKYFLRWFKPGLVVHPTDSLRR